MMDESKVWLVIENKEDNEQAEQVKQLAQKIAQKENVSYKTLIIEYRELKPFMSFNYLQIGKVNNRVYDIISGILEIDELQYKLEGFIPETTIDMRFFRPFFNELTKNVKLRSETIIKIYYGKDLPVWFDIEGRIGAIAPRVDEE